MLLRIKLFKNSPWCHQHSVFQELENLKRGGEGGREERKKTEKRRREREKNLKPD